MGNKRNRNKGAKPQRPPQGGRHFRVPLEAQTVGPAWNPNSLMLRQMGLHSPEGLMRLINILVHKHDPHGVGITITAQDLERAVYLSTTAGRRNLKVQGAHDSITLKMVTDQDARTGVQADNAIAKAEGRETSPEVDKPMQPVQPGRGTPPGFA